MKKFKNNINKLALREEVKAIKIGIGVFMGVYLATLIGNTKATTMSITVFIILTMYPTSSSSRAYFKQRVFANIYGLLVHLLLERCLIIVHIPYLLYIFASYYFIKYLNLKEKLVWWVAE